MRIAFAACALLLMTAFAAPPAEAKEKLEFVFLDRVEDAVRIAIGELPKQPVTPLVRVAA